MTTMNTQQGVGLIEVMVALLLLMVAILGYTALQGQAINSTNEAYERTQSLVMMRNIAEKIHANPSAIEIYEENLNKSYASSSAPSEKCGLDGVTADFCSPEQLAVAESYNLKTKLQDYDFQIQMHPCPNTGGTGTDAADNIMFSYCLISAWGDTTPTIGKNGKIDCLTERVVGKNNVVEAAGGNYHARATCMMMEI